MIATRFSRHCSSRPHAARAHAAAIASIGARGALYVSGRELGDEYRYVLERRNASAFRRCLLDKPSLLLNPWARRTTSTDVAAAAPVARSAPRPAHWPRPATAARCRTSPQPSGRRRARTSATTSLPTPPRVIANLVARRRTASLTIPLAELGDATCVTVIVDDPAGTACRHARARRDAARTARPAPAPRARSAEPRHAAEAIAPLATGRARS